MTMRLARAGVAAGALLLTSAPITAFAADAPAGTAEAAALEIPEIITISGTDATANNDTATAHADVVALGGQTVVGGGQESPGESSDVLIDTGETPLGRLQVLPWRAAATEDSAESQAAVLRLMLLAPDVLVVDVMQSESAASWSATNSSGSGSNDGADAALGGDALRLTLLHNEADSSGTGHAYLVSVNDNEIGTPDNAAMCTLTLPSVLRVACLAVSGGVGQATSNVASLGVGDDALTADAFAASVTGGTGTAVSPTVALPSGAGVTDNSRELGLALTGSSALRLVAAALALALTGLALRAWAGRPHPTA